MTAQHTDKRTVTTSDTDTDLRAALAADDATDDALRPALIAVGYSPRYFRSPSMVGHRRPHVADLVDAVSGAVSRPTRETPAIRPA